MLPKTINHCINTLPDPPIPHSKEKLNAINLFFSEPPKRSDSASTTPNLLHLLCPTLPEHPAMVTLSKPYLSHISSTYSTPSNLLFLMITFYPHLSSKLSPWMLSHPYSPLSLPSSLKVSSQRLSRQARSHHS